MNSVKLRIENKKNIGRLYTVDDVIRVNAKQVRKMSSPNVGKHRQPSSKVIPIEVLNRAWKSVKR